MQARYIRFHEAVMTPGRAGSEIKVAVIDDQANPLRARDERMQDITVMGGFVRLRALRPDPKGSKEPVLAERFVPIHNVRDFEPSENSDDGPPKKNPKKENAE